MTAPLPPPVPDELGRLISQARRQLWSVCSHALEAHGRSMLEWQVCARLVARGPMTQGDVAQATSQHPAGVSRLVTDMEAGGLVRRHRDPADRRRIIVETTPAGRALYADGLPTIQAAVSSVAAALTDEEQRHLNHLLKKLIGTSGA